jgi:small subunit ribosomal protein S18
LAEDIDNNGGMEYEYEAPGPGGRRGRGKGGPRKFIHKPKICMFCVEKNARIDYKQADMLRRYVTERGKIRPRRQTGMCAKHQRAMSTAVKRARHLALLPYTASVSH